VLDDAEALARTADALFRRDDFSIIADDFSIAMPITPRQTRRGSALPMIRFSSLPPSELVLCGFAFCQDIPQGPYHSEKMKPKYSESTQVFFFGSAVRQFTGCMKFPALV